MKRVHVAVLLTLMAAVASGKLYAGEVVIITEPITTTADDDDAVWVSGLDGTDYIENQSTVRTEGQSADALRYSGIGGTVVNSENAVLETTGDGFAVGIRVAGDEIYIRNDGSIETFGVNGDGIIVFGNRNDEGLLIPREPEDFVGSYVENNGHITVHGPGSDAFVVEGDNTTFTNTGTITSNGGIREPGVLEDNSTGVILFGYNNHLINDGGTISTTGVDSTTVSVSDGGTVYNTGLIENTGEQGELSSLQPVYGSAIYASDNVTITNNGTIRGDVLGGYGSQRVELGPGSVIEGVVQVDIWDEFLSTPAVDVLVVDSGAGTQALDGDAFIGFDSLNKTGIGTLALSGHLDLAAQGTGLIEQGDIRVMDGAITLDQLVVSEGAALQGVGEIFGDVLVQPGGYVEPGLSPGLLSIEGDLMAAGAVLAIDLAGLGLGESDFIEVAGIAELTGTLIEFIFTPEYLPKEGDLLTFLAADQMLGLDSASFVYSGLADGFGFEVSWIEGALVFEALTDGVAVVPIPPAMLLFGSALLGLVGLKRRNA